MPDEEVDKPPEADWFLVEGPASEEEFFPEPLPAEPLWTIVEPPGLGATPPVEPGPAPGGALHAEGAGTPPSQGEPAPAAAAPAESALAAEPLQASMPESAAPETHDSGQISASEPHLVAPDAPTSKAPVVVEPLAEPRAASSADEPAAATPEEEPTPPAAATPPEVRPAPPQGLRLADALRIGGKEAVAPRLLTALFVIVRTPQPVRLGQIVPLREPRTLIGRGRGVGFFLDDASAAEVHAVVTHQETADGPGFYLYASEFNPTRINGMPADVRTRLHDGDRIEIGSTELVYRETALGRGGS